MSDLHISAFPNLRISAMSITRASAAKLALRIRDLIIPDVVMDLVQCTLGYCIWPHAFHNCTVQNICMLWVSAYLYVVGLGVSI